MAEQLYVYRWAKYRPELKGRTCVVLARGAKNSVMVQWADGTKDIVSRYAVRKVK